MDTKYLAQPEFRKISMLSKTSQKMCNWGLPKVKIIK